MTTAGVPERRSARIRCSSKVLLPVPVLPITVTPRDRLESGSHTSWPSPVSCPRSTLTCREVSSGHLVLPGRSRPLNNLDVPIAVLGVDDRVHHRGQLPRPGVFV